MFKQDFKFGLFILFSIIGYSSFVILILEKIFNVKLL
jgi:hypothetical protein